MHQEPLSADGLASEEHDMGADTRTAGGLTGQVLEVIHHPDDRFYELPADGQFAGLIVYEDARPPWRLGVSDSPGRRARPDAAARVGNAWRRVRACPAGAIR
jgi:hypothetical protein